MIKVIRVVIIPRVLLFGPFTEAFHSITSMRANHKSFLRSRENECICSLSRLTIFLFPGNKKVRFEWAERERTMSMSGAHVRK